MSNIDENKDNSSAYSEKEASARDIDENMGTCKPKTKKSRAEDTLNLCAHSIVEDTFSRLLDLFPTKDGEYLYEKSKEFSVMPEGTEFSEWVYQFVDKESIIDSRLQYLMTMFENGDVQFLKEKATVFEFDEAGEANFKLWVQNQVEKQKKEKLLEGRYQVLLGLFPEKDPKDLEIKALEYNYDEEGTAAFEKWINENKRSECRCCYDADCLEVDMLSCSQGHLFCKECVKRGSEAAFGESKTELLCFHENCKDTFEFITLQKALDSTKFSKWSSKIQASEVEKAGCSGLESCPFCPYAVIFESKAEDDQTFHCQHPDCGKKSCRLCHEISHVPLRCDQVEMDTEVKKRIYIENKMSEAMFKRCFKCDKAIIKNGGCNMVKCSCGAQMCYYHQLPKCTHRGCQAIDYQKAETERVTTAAKNAKEEMHAQYPDITLKIDPTKPL